MSCVNDTEACIALYQKYKQSQPLINCFELMFKKYTILFKDKIIDFHDYNQRFFISFYLKEKKDRSNFRKGSYHAKELVRKAYRVLDLIRPAFEGVANIYGELIIPFLQCAEHYKIKSSFQNYIYIAYKYYLKRHIDQLIKSYLSFHTRNLPMAQENIIKLEESLKIYPQSTLQLDLDNDLALTHPDWINGKLAQYPFNQLNSLERRILVETYTNTEAKTDRDIAIIVGYHPKSISRIRKKVIHKIIHYLQEAKLWQQQPA